MTGRQAKHIMISIRPFDYSDQDYERRVSIYNATNPVPASVEFERRFDQTTLIAPGRYHYDVLVETNDPPGETVAAGRVIEAFFDDEPDKYLVEINVLPDHEATGARRKLYDHLVNHVLPRRPRLLETVVLDGETDTIAFLESEGFSEVQRQHESVLDTVTFDPETFAALLQRVADEGISIRTYAELTATDPDFQRKMYALENRLQRDVPWHQDALRMPPFEEWVTQFDDNPDLLEDAYVVAVDGDEYVASSALWASQATDRFLFTALTGVLPAYRHRGIATALKVRAITAGKQRVDQDGRPPLIRTSNEINNPMYRINIRLGFEPVADSLVYLKLLDSS